MKKVILPIMLTILGADAFAQQAPQLGKASVDEVINAMTIDEKVQLIVGFGSHFTTNYSAAIGNSGDLVPGAAGQSNGIPRLGIPPTVFSDGPAGLRINATRKGDSRTYNCTHFPVETLLACTWNPELVKEVGKAMGDEVKRYGIDVLLAPAINIQRNPLNGRNFEYYSEDPLLAGEMAAAMINGLQSNGIGTSVKHFAMNNQETNRTDNNSVASPRTIREIYLKPFEIAVKKSQPWTVMSSYNLLNGTHTAERADLLTDLLRKEWGFKGMVVSDWYGGRDFVAMVNAGNDMIQPGHPQQVAILKKAIRQGNLSIELVDRNIKRILEYVMKTPRFKGYIATNDPDLKAHANVTRQSAAEGMVLLKNEKKTLPLISSLKNENKKINIALFGRTSYQYMAGGTGSGNVNSSYTVSLTDGLRNAGLHYNEQLAAAYENYIKTEEAKIPEKTWFETKTMIPEMTLSTEQATQYAQTADVAIITIGKSSGEGRDRKFYEYHLTDAEQQMLKTVCSVFHKQGKRVIVILNVTGVIETASWKDLPDAILLAWTGGQESGNSVTDILTGRMNPSGKLTMTFPVTYNDIPSSKTFVDVDSFNEEDYAKFLRHHPVNVTGRSTGVYNSYYDEGIYVGYRWFDTHKKHVSYPFGYGLSYTSFTYGRPIMTRENGNITVSLPVKNTGKFAGKEVIQVYVSAPGKDMDKPMKELKGFAKTNLLGIGESQTITISIPENTLGSFDEKNSCWTLEGGTYQVYIAASCEDVRHRIPVTIEGCVIENVSPILLLEKDAKPHYTSIRPGIEWMDTNGNPIQAHGFSVIFDEKTHTYYWYGEDKGRTTQGSNVWTYGVRCYSSKDFYNWEDRGHLIMPDTVNVLSPIHYSQGLDRPHIIHNPKTGKYVCWIKNLSDETQFFTILQSDHFMGPYTIVNPGFRPNGYEAGDFDLYVDEQTGKGYVWFERPHWEMICCELNDDFTGVTDKLSHHYTGKIPPATREAPTHFVHSGKHYIFSSGTSGYYPNESLVSVFTDYHGKYKDLGNPHPSDTSHTSFYSQITDVIKIPGKKNLYVAVADRWMPQIVGTDEPRQEWQRISDRFRGHQPRAVSNDPVVIMDRSQQVRNGWDVTYNARYVWLPVTFENGKPIIEWKDEWKLEDYE